MESMDDKKNENETKDKQQSTVDTVGAAIMLNFPTSHQDPTPQLAPLRDNHSNYTAVAKTCLQLNQFAMNGSSSTMDDYHSGVSHSNVFHEPTLISSLGGAFAALIECLQNHHDRRAKILVCRTMAALARATYAKLRYSPHVFAVRESTHSRLEDEAGTDVPMALITAALEDNDDGVAAAALHSLGLLCLGSGTTPGTMVEDELWREIASLVQQRTSPYAPTLADLEEEESYIPQVELQSRILENIVSPRLLQLICRVMSFEQEAHIGMTLPVLTTSLVYLSKTSVLLHAINREAYVKRWVELDYVSLVNTFVRDILLPTMKSSSYGQLAHAAATSSIRLIHACPNASWVGEVSYWATLVLKEELSSSSNEDLGVSGNNASLETEMTNISALLICARAIPFPERTSILLFCLDRIRSLPSTTSSPHGVQSAGVLLGLPGILQYRKPARSALLTELALSFFIDGPVDSSTDNKNPRSSALEAFLKSNDFTSASQDMQNQRVIQLREEIVLAFCMVAVGVGRRHKDAPEYSSEVTSTNDGNAHYDVTAPKEEFEEWVRMSIMVLQSFSGCLVWSGKSTPTYMDEHLSLMTAAQASYARLVQELTHAMGLLPTPSIALKMAPTACPSHLLWDQLEESAEFLGQFDSSPLDNTTLLEKLGKVMDSCIKKEIKGAGMKYHHLRHYLLTLAADHWVQARYLAAKKEFEGKGGGNASLNAAHACELLEALTPRRVFARVVENHKTQIESYGKQAKDMYKQYAQETVSVFVACVENMALAASDWRKRFGNSAETKSIYNAAIASLQGKAPGSEVDPNATILPVCQSAIDRIQAAFASNDQAGLDHISLSPILLNAGDLKRRPEVTATRVTQGEDAFDNAYVMQLCRQIIASRIDHCVLSVPAVASLQGSARKQNWLRLALPPLPPSRNPQVPIASLPKFSWGSNVMAPSGGSDACAMTLAYSIRRSMRYDGENEFRLMVVMRVHNITAVEVPEGLRLNLSLLQEAAQTSIHGQDDTSQEVLKTLTEGDANFVNESTLRSAITLFKSELGSGEHLTWEIVMDQIPMTGQMTLYPSIEYRAMEDEPTHATWVGADGREGDRDDTSAISGISQQSVGSKSEGENKENDLKRNITIPGEEMKLSPMVGLQPCPIVFFRDGCGDISTFRFLWARLPCQVTPLKVVPDSDSGSTLVSLDSIRLAALCTLKFGGNAIPGGEIARLWAFTSLTGKHVFFVLAESDGDERGVVEKTLHIRSNDKQLLCCLAGTSIARQSLIAALLPGHCPI